MAMDVKVFGIGSNDAIPLQVDSSRNATRTSVAPTEHVVANVVGGHYSLGATTGAIAAIAASGQIFSVRWTDQAKICLLERVLVSAVCTAFSTGTGTDMEMILTHNFSANAAGGTAITPNAASNMMRMQNMAPSSFANNGQIMVSTTTALTAGTQTFDSNAIGAVQMGGVAGAGTASQGLYDRTALGMYPVTLALNQGFVVRAVTAVPASNTWRYSLIMVWKELGAY